MNNEEAYNHGYNGTLTLDELMALFPPCGLRDEEPSQFSAWRSGRRGIGGRRRIPRLSVGSPGASRVARQGPIAPRPRAGVAEAAVRVVVSSARHTFTR